MATVEETIITGRKYRIFDAVNNIWKRVSFWTKATDVEFEDGLNLEDKFNDFQEETESTIDEFKGETEEALDDLKEEIESDLTKITLNGSTLATLSFSISGNVLTITTTNKE